MKVRGNEKKVIVLGGKEGSICEVFVDGMRLEDVSEFKYFGCVLDESSTVGADCRMNVAIGRKVGVAIRSLMNTKSLQHKYPIKTTSCSLGIRIKDSVRGKRVVRSGEGDG